MTFIFSIAGSGVIGFTPIIPISLVISSNIFSSLRQRLIPSHALTSRNKSSILITRNPPFALCSAPGWIIVKSVRTDPKCDSRSTLPSRLRRVGLGSITTGAPKVKVLSTTTFTAYLRQLMIGSGCTICVPAPSPEGIMGLKSSIFSNISAATSSR